MSGPWESCLQAPGQVSLPGSPLVLAPTAGHRHIQAAVRCCHAVLALVFSSTCYPSFPVCPARLQRGDEHGAEVRHSERRLLCTPQPAHREVLCILGPGPGCFYHSYGVWTRVPGQAGQGTEISKTFCLPSQAAFRGSALCPVLPVRAVLSVVRRLGTLHVLRVQVSPSALLSLMKQKPASAPSGI